MVITSCFRKNLAEVVSLMNQNDQLANELHKPIIQKLKKKQKFIHLLDTIFGVLI